MTTERQNSLAVSKLYPNHYNQNNVENRASYYEFGLFAEIMFIDNIIEIQYNDINNVMSGSNICCEFYLIPKIYFAFVFVVDEYWVLFLPLDTNSCDHNCWCKYTLVVCTSAGQLSR